MSRTNQIYFDHPGDFGLWEQTCLPRGNGYMGASMFGGIEQERVVLNEKTFWAGGPCAARPDYYGGNHRGRYTYVKQVQKLLAAGENARAEELLPMRTGDGERTYKLLRGLLESCTFQNLWDFHPPFQIDGNFGASAGIAEMLLQSHEESIRLLPACPADWNTGKFTGLCARGGFVIDASWEKGSVRKLRIMPKLGGKCEIDVPVNGEVRHMSLDTEKGKALEFTF